MERGRVEPTGRLNGADQDMRNNNPGKIVQHAPTTRRCLEGSTEGGLIADGRRFILHGPAAVRKVCKRDGPKLAIGLIDPICKYAHIGIDDASD